MNLSRSCLISPAKIHIKQLLHCRIIPLSKQSLKWVINEMPRYGEAISSVLAHCVRVPTRNEQRIHSTRWRRPLGYLIGHFPQKSLLFMALVRQETHNLRHTMSFRHPVVALYAAVGSFFFPGFFWGIKNSRWVTSKPNRLLLQTSLWGGYPHTHTHTHSHTRVHPLALWHPMSDRSLSFFLSFFGVQILARNLGWPTWLPQTAAHLLMTVMVPAVALWHPLSSVLLLWEESFYWRLILVVGIPRIRGLLHPCKQWHSLRFSTPWVWE